MRQFKSNLSKTFTSLFWVVILFSFRFPVQSESLTLDRVLEVADLKLAAFQILETKCNVCHEKKNPRRVFNLENMSELAPKIHKQVFVKKRMPKGNEIRLTSEEFDTLKNWLLTEKIN